MLRGYWCLVIVTLNMFPTYYDGALSYTKRFNISANLSGTQGGLYRASVLYLINNIYFPNKYINIFKYN